MCGNYTSSPFERSKRVAFRAKKRRSTKWWSTSSCWTVTQTSDTYRSRSSSVISSLATLLIEKSVKPATTRPSSNQPLPTAALQMLICTWCEQKKKSRLAWKTWPSKPAHTLKSKDHYHRYKVDCPSSISISSKLKGQRSGVIQTRSNPSIVTLTGVRWHTTKCPTKLNISSLIHTITPAPCTTVTSTINQLQQTRHLTLQMLLFPLSMANAFQFKIGVETAIQWVLITIITNQAKTPSQTRIESSKAITCIVQAAAAVFYISSGRLRETPTWRRCQRLTSQPS